MNALSPLTASDDQLAHGSRPVTDKAFVTSKSPYLMLGDRVMYAGGWGRNVPMPGTVTGGGIENGEEVIDVQLDCGAKHWGYPDQFTTISETDDGPVWPSREMGTYQGG